MTVAVVGPTATGKSALGIALAQALGGDVVNADSMQLYKGMDIGTDKVPVAERGGVPHHLLDVWPVTHPASVAEYQRLGRAVLTRLEAAGRAAVVVGGSGLYVRALLDDLAFPGTDAAVRARLEDELAAAGPRSLHARLAELDPAAAAAIVPTNGRRIVRALEVIELTGAPFSATLPGYPATGAVQIGLDLDNPVLDERVAGRVARMWARGLVEEVQGLAERGLRRGRTASRALGYQQVLAQLDGRLTEAEAREETVRATRRFVRRQRSWFRRDPRVHWLAADRPGLLEAALEIVRSTTPC